MIYLDHNSTTFLNQKVLEALKPYADSLPLNPSSVHQYGREARALFEEARFGVINSLNASNYNLVFTSSGTEGNNLVLKNFYQDQIIISAIEHLSVYEHIKYNDNISLIPINDQGLVDLEALEQALKNRKNSRALVSIIYANNETGVIQNLTEIIKIVRDYEALIHSDFSQAVGKMHVNLNNYDLDFVTISGHKFGSMVGIGGLFYKKSHHLIPDMIGGGQEKGMRSGTQNVLGALSMAIALEDAILDLKEEYIQDLRDTLEQKILDFDPEVQIASNKALRLPNTSMIIMPGCQSQKQIVYFDLNGFAVSAGSACSSGKITSSRVLEAMNYGVDSACGIRVSLAKTNTMDEIENFAHSWNKLYKRQITSTGTQ
ncbi:hypothetical protein phytr_5010 [Candidatus Phycorickettsia trachydisci]|uniref:Cysteine desulfurase n=1 Tax=Candidatus Phycorickettsia trachydisci TaxID=2115978 RepID=A0A2P1P845_9RICK|nr:cysteine desulfurase family protein [Candidatus Phycorickettsia trachydisci]AVP87448.1 hypothetical protein phytr_5010 [Candidatus Phycorickettsia trachydisci]